MQNANDTVELKSLGEKNCQLQGILVSILKCPRQQETMEAIDFRT